MSDLCTIPVTITVRIFARYFIISETISAYINMFGKLFDFIKNIMEKCFQIKLSLKNIDKYGI
jgi:hypothetical protein